MGLTSREEDILRATIDGTEYNKPPQSRVEELLIELKEAIEEGGGGGGSTVTITPTLETGEKIADYSINGVEGALYAPEGGGGGSSLKVVDKLYEASSGAGAPLNTLTPYLNSHKLNDYDVITVILSDPTMYAQGTYTQMNSFTPDALNGFAPAGQPPTKRPVCLVAHNDSAVTVHFGATAFEVLGNTGPTGEEPSVYCIYGVKFSHVSEEIEINPEGEATDVLEKLKVGDDIYGVEGGGGTEVVANPEGEPTDVLETIKIGDDIFGLPNSKILIDDVIYTDTSGQTGTLSITLDERLDKYDAIYFEFYFPSESTYVSANPSPLQIVVASPEGASHDYFFQTYPSYGNRYITLESIDGGKNATLVASAWNDLNPSVYKIHGIKFGSSPVQAKNVVLWSGEQTPTAGNPYRANLSTSFRDYDFLVVECHESMDDTNMPFTMPVSSITDNEGYGYEYQQSGIYFVPIDDRHIDLYLFASINPTTYTCIRGIKCGIQKDDPFKKDLLWSGIARMINSTGHLGKPITEYPFLMMYYSDSSVAGMDEWHVELVDTSKLTDYENNTFSYEYYGTAYIRGKFTDASNFLITASMADSGIYPVLREIHGVDFGSGNGQNGSFQKDLLYAAPTLNGAPLQTDIPYLTDRNFFDYDLILMIQCNTVDGANNLILSPFSFTPDELYRTDEGLYTLCTSGYKERWFSVDFSEHSFRIPQHAATNESGDYAPSLYKMYGFKFGGPAYSPDNIYDSQERVIGEWFGETLYQKTITIPNFSTSNFEGGWYYGNVDISDYVDIDDYETAHVGCNLTHSFITLTDDSVRNVGYFDYQNLSSVSVMFIFTNRSGTLTLTLEYTKGSAI